MGAAMLLTVKESAEVVDENETQSVDAGLRLGDNETGKSREKNDLGGDE